MTYNSMDDRSVIGDSLSDLVYEMADLDSISRACADKIIERYNKLAMLIPASRCCSFEWQPFIDEESLLVDEFDGWVRGPIDQIRKLAPVMRPCKVGGAFWEGRVPNMACVTRSKAPVIVVNTHGSISSTSLSVFPGVNLLYWKPIDSPV